MPIKGRNLSYPFDFTGDTTYGGSPLARTYGHGKTFYVNAGDAVTDRSPVGLDTQTGLSWNQAFLTMSKAFTTVKSGDRIVLRGKVKEQLSTPLNVFDVEVVGAQVGRPHHADASDSTHPAGGTTSATWTIPTSPTAATPLCTVRQQGWVFRNLLFASQTTSNDANSAVTLVRATPDDPAETDGGHASFLNCRFASGHGGIRDTGGCPNVLIEGCNFESLTGYAILGVGNVGLGQFFWNINHNLFYGFTNGIKITAFGCRIQDNTFTDGGTPNTTFVLNTNNGAGADNFIVDNYFQTTTANFNTPDVVGCTTDVWGRNVSIDATSAGVGTNTEFGQPA